MNDNYAVINGKKIELTEKQIKALGFEIRKPPFELVDEGRSYYFINDFGDVVGYIQRNDPEDDALFNNINYFNDACFAEQVALHQLLYRKLLKFAYENKYEDATWEVEHTHWYIYYNMNSDKFDIDANTTYKRQGVYFSTSRGAERAIKEVIEPFIKEHPEYKW